MKISILDGSNYFKGLLILIRKDHKITESETELMKHIGKTLGFDQEFCDSAIKEILNNEFIDETPPVFSNIEIAEKFIKDGLSLAYSDSLIHAEEEFWLREIAEKNSIDMMWFVQEQQNAIKRNGPPVNLEVDDLSIEYT